VRWAPGCGVVTDIRDRKFKIPDELASNLRLAQPFTWVLAKTTPLFIRISSSVLTLGGNCPFAQLSPVNSPFGRQIPRGGLLKSVHLRTKFPRQFHCAHGPLVAPIALALERIQ
jgi:hypothetical protein